MEAVQLYCQRRAGRQEAVVVDSAVMEVGLFFFQATSDLPPRGRLSVSGE